VEAKGPEDKDATEHDADEDAADAWVGNQHCDKASDR
jgi:hypothetical protein